jgi:hypothetical protein
MWRSLRQLLTTLTVLGTISVSAGAEDAPLPSGGSQNLLILRSGRIVSGQVSRVGDLYYVALPNGEIRIKATDVDFSCQTLDEAYRRKQAAIKQGDAKGSDATGHLKLAYWCQRHQLLGAAAAELADAIATDPNHPLIPVLQRRLEAAMRPPPDFAASQQPEQEQTSQLPSLDELDRLVRIMPTGTVETFTRTIQPLLVNNCTAVGCHGPGSESEFRMERISRNRPPSRRTTQRNLHSVMQWVDRKNPSASKLLVEPGLPHGNTDQPPFTGRRAGRQHQLLVDWVAQVTGQQEKDAHVPDTATAEVDAPLQTNPTTQPLGDSIPSSIPRLLGEAGEFKEIPPPQDEPAVTPTAATELIHPMTRSSSNVKRGAPLRQFVPADPFDPEIFNRRFFDR